MDKLRLHVSSLPKSYQSTVFTFRDAGEEDDDCMLRWLRARRFKVKDVEEVRQSTKFVVTKCTLLQILTLQTHHHRETTVNFY